MVFFHVNIYHIYILKRVFCYAINGLVDVEVTLSKCIYFKCETILHGYNNFYIIPLSRINRAPVIFSFNHVFLILFIFISLLSLQIYMWVELCTVSL